jgi:magnesium chelatase family protein
LLDRFDLRVHVGRPATDQLLGSAGGEPSWVVRERVLEARCRAQRRGHGPNSTLTVATLDEVAPLTADARAIMRSELDQGRLSGRGLHRVRRVARTLADLRGAEEVEAGDLVTALQLRVDVLAPPSRVVAS